MVLIEAGRLKKQEGSMPHKDFEEKGFLSFQVSCRNVNVEALSGKVLVVKQPCGALIFGLSPSGQAKISTNTGQHVLTYSGRKRKELMRFSTWLRKKYTPRSQPSCTAN